MQQMYPKVVNWSIGRPLLDRTFSALVEDGRLGREGIVFWAGSRQDGLAKIRTIIIPSGPGVIKRPNFLRVKDSVMASLSELLDPPRLVLLGQIHTHRLGVSHSPVDNNFIIDTPGYLSVVIDRYGLQPSSDPGIWGVHIGQGPGFRRLTPHEARSCFAVTEEVGADVRVVQA